MPSSPSNSSNSRPAVESSYLCSFVVAIRTNSRRIPRTPGTYDPTFQASQQYLQPQQQLNYSYAPQQSASQNSYEYSSAAVTTESPTYQPGYQDQGSSSGLEATHSPYQPSPGSQAPTPRYFPYSRDDYGGPITTAARRPSINSSAEVPAQRQLSQRKQVWPKACKMPLTDPM